MRRSNTHQLTRKLKRITEIRTYPLPGIGNVEYRISPEMNTPYTLGFVKPFIVAPAEFPNSKLSEMILRHEYSHLRRRDSIVKLICLLAICLHCFNPLTILTFLLTPVFLKTLQMKLLRKAVPLRNEEPTPKLS